MAFTIPSFGAVIADLVADFQNRFPRANVSKLSGHWKRLAVIGGGIAALHRHIQVVARDALPDTAVRPMIDRHGGIYGATRNSATAASKSDALRLTGTAASAFTAGTQLTTTDGLVFQLNESGSIPVAGFIDVDVLAVSLGSATRKSAGTSMTFTAPPVGIDATAVLQLAMDEGGTDEEQDGPYRVRILDVISQPNEGGAANDFRQWAKEVAGVAEAYVWPLRGGLGSVHVAALKIGTGTARTLSPSELAVVAAHIDDERPTAYEDFEMLTTAAEPNDVELLIEPQDDYEFDWGDQVPLAVSSWTALTRVLKFTTPRPADMDIGDRLIYVRTAATKNTGAEMVVEGFGAADEVVLRAHDDLTTSPPQAANAVYAGGPTVAPVRDAVVAHMDGLGPGRPDTVDTTKDYSFGSNYWDGTLRRSKLHSFAVRQAGVVDVDVITPAANVNPSNAAPALSVGYITPRQVLVRRKW